jgi:hypothetical protein
LEKYVGDGTAHDDEVDGENEADQQQEQQQFQRDEALVATKTHDGNDSVDYQKNGGPINGKTARRELKEFGLGYYRHLLVPANSGRDYKSSTAPVTSAENALTSQAYQGLSSSRQVDFVSLAATIGAGSWSSSYNQYETEPDLRIPVGGEFAHVAQ